MFEDGLICLAAPDGVFLCLINLAFVGLCWTYVGLAQVTPRFEPPSVFLQSPLFKVQAYPVFW